MNFYEWAESTQISRLSSLTDFGPSDEIVEVVQNFYDEKVRQLKEEKNAAFVPVA